jgi:hypothetical protein
MKQNMLPKMYLVHASAAVRSNISLLSIPDGAARKHMIKAQTKIQKPRKRPAFNNNESSLLLIQNELPKDESLRGRKSLDGLKDRRWKNNKRLGKKNRDAIEKNKTQRRATSLKDVSTKPLDSSSFSYALTKAITAYFQTA